MSKHDATDEDEDKLFQNGINMIESKCSRCDTPILLVRDPHDTEYYYITEKPIQNK
ncbi:MAG: hypothetical protein ACRDFB_10465 [Rhabdochlamydiaceae bacterium]